MLLLLLDIIFELVSTYNYPLFYIKDLFFYSSAAARYRRKAKKETMKLQDYRSSDREKFTNNCLNKRSKNYLMDDKLTTNSILSRKSNETISKSTNESERTTNINSVNKEQKTNKLHKYENPSVKSCDHQDSEKESSIIKKPHPKSNRPSVTVSTVNKSSRTSESIKNNTPTNSSTVLQERHESPSTPSTKIQVIKLPRNKVSSFHDPPTTNISESNNYQMTNQSDTLKMNKNSVIDISNRKPTRVDSINIIHLKETQNSVLTSNNVQNPRISHISRANTKGNNNKQKRASSFGGTTVSKIRTIQNNNKLSINHSQSVVISNNNGNKMSTRVTIVSVLKEQSSYL